MGRRKYPRTEISHSATFLFKEQSYSGCLIRNFSQGGLFVTWGESILADIMGPGFYPPKQRQQAVIELEGVRVSAVVHIVYVSQNGFGVAFNGSDETLYTYLQDYTPGSVGTSDPPQSVPTPQQPIAAIQSIVDRLSGKTVDFLKKQFRQFNVLAKHELIAATDHCAGSAEQGDLFFAVTTLEAEEARIINAYISGIEAKFMALLSGNPQVEGSVREDELGSELELVDEQEFDEWILLDAIAHNVESQCATQVYQMNFALSHLFQRPVKNELNPLSPIALLLQMRGALGDHPFTPKAKELIYQAFSQSIFIKIQRLYGELIASLHADGIKTENSENAIESPQVNAGDTLDQEQPNARNLENLASLLDGVNARQTEQAGQEASYPVASQGQVLEAMQSMPWNGGLIGQLEYRLGQEMSQRFSLDPVTRAAVGVTEELVAAVQQDEMLSEDVQQLVNQLEIPFIQENINDPGILENPAHPGRRFLEAVEGLAPYISLPGAVDAKGRHHNAGLQQLINDIQSGSIDNISAVTEQIEGLQDQQKEGFQRNSKLAIESCNNKERLWQAHSLVENSLKEKILGKSVSIALDSLFEYGWVNLLIHTVTLHGKSSVEWKAYLRIVDLLLRLFHSQHPLKRLTREQASDILKVINKGLNDYPVFPEGAQQFTSELMQALVEEGEFTKKFTINRVTIDEKYLKRLFHGYVVGPEDSISQPVAQNWVDLVDNLTVGDWIVQYASRERLRLLNLAWKNPDSGRRLLVDGSGIKVLYAGVTKLAGLFAENKLAVLEDQDIPVVDRAVQRILKNSYDNVQQEVSYDELTGLLNRRAFERLLTELLRGEMEEGDQHAIILLDVDQFGLVNDLCGFEGGDKLLQSISNILRTYLPDNAHLSRTGDDEFAILASQSSLDQGFQLAEEHRQAINAFKYTWDNQVVPVSASVGVVAIDSREQTAAELLKAASSACSIAKQLGRNCTRIYRATDMEFQQHRALINSVAVIENALENDKIVLVAQPIVPLQEGAGSAHYEILLRVEGENGELQSPVHFILAAERYNFMRAVDRWVVDTFFETINMEMQKLQDIGGFSINLSSQSLADHEFKAYLLQQIENSSIPREKLGFEITETAMIKDSQDAINFIKEIKKSGCSFYLDDFGSGYASFSYLKEMPVDYVKIDGIFIRDLLQDKASLEMVKAITGISHFMHKKVVAEFVEDQETADELRKVGVDFIQGYHVGRPLPLNQIFAPEEFVNVG